MVEMGVDHGVCSRRAKTSHSELPRAHGAESWAEPHDMESSHSARLAGRDTESHPSLSTRATSGSLPTATPDCQVATSPGILGGGPP